MKPLFRLIQTKNVLPNRYLFKEIFLEIYRFFFKKWYSIDILQMSNVYVKNWYIYLK